MSQRRFQKHFSKLLVNCFSFSYGWTINIGSFVCQKYSLLEIQLQSYYRPPVRLMLRCYIKQNWEVNYFSSQLKLIFSYSIYGLLEIQTKIVEKFWHANYYIKKNSPSWIEMSKFSEENIARRFLNSRILLDLEICTLTCNQEIDETLTELVLTYAVLMFLVVLNWAQLT